MALSESETRAFYDRLGAKQDTQAFYEDPATDDLLAHASFSRAGKVFELGCGTGRLADHLLSDVLPADAMYVGCDLSSTMVALVSARLAEHAPRAGVFQADGTPHFALADRCVDRVVAAYVLDLLPRARIEWFLEEAYRVLDAGGKLCLVGLTEGVTLPSRLVAGAWKLVYRARPSLVGGCRPIMLERYLDRRRWEPEYRNTVVAYGVPSEVMVARAAGKRP